MLQGAASNAGRDDAKNECEQILRDAERAPTIHGDDFVYKTFKLKYIQVQRSALVVKLAAELDKVRCKLMPVLGNEADRKQRRDEHWKKILDGVKQLLDSALEVDTTIISKEP